MKLHLPLLLFRALVAVAALSPVVQAEAHDRYTNVTVYDTSDVNQSGTINYTLYGNLTWNAPSSQILTSESNYLYFTSKSGTVDGETAPLYSITINDSSISDFFHAKSYVAEYLKSFTVSGATEYGLFDSYVLAFRDIEEIEFSSNNSNADTMIGNSSAVVTMSGNGTVRILDNRSTSNSSYDKHGGVMYADAVHLVGNEFLNISGNELNGASTGKGGVIYAATGVHIDWNDAVSVCNNAVNGSTSSSYSDSYGGVIHAPDLTIDFNDNVTFSGNAVYASCSSSSIIPDAWGGAIYISNESGRLSVAENRNVNFEGNQATISATTWSSAQVRGGAICAMFDNSTGSGASVLLSGNGDVRFANNAGIGVESVSGGAVYARAITLSKNRNVQFDGNVAKGMNASGAITVHGGALYANSILLDRNVSLSMTGNSVIADSKKSLANAYGGAIYAVSAGGTNGSVEIVDNGDVVFSGNYSRSQANYGNYGACGGAIFGDISSSILIRGNDNVTFSSNSVYSGLTHARGGAIYGNTISICENGQVTFRGNSATANEDAQGAAIYGSGGNISICDNGNVIFEKNYRKAGIGILRSIDAKGGGLLSLSARAGRSIEFRDSLYAADGYTVSLNANYTDALGVPHKQAGDIILTGAYTAQHLSEMKGKDGTESELVRSRTSVIDKATLYRGRLCIVDGAILEGGGLTAAAGSTSTVLLKHATLDQAGARIHFNSGTKFEMTGPNTVWGKVLMEPSSTLKLNVSTANKANANMKLAGGSFTLGGKINLTLAQGGALTTGTYKLLSGVTLPSDWLSKFKLSMPAAWKGGTGSLSYSDNTLWLYLNIPALTAPVWNNWSGTRIWSASDVNWTQHNIAYAFKNGLPVCFYNTGAGDVRLVGSLTPSSVLVHNASGKDYTWNGLGRLAGSAKLTKKGAGKLTINTSNTFTGGTELYEGTLMTGVASALGTGKITVRGGTLHLNKKAVNNTIVQTGSAIIHGSSFGGYYALNGGTLKSGSYLNIASGKSATLNNGTVSGTITGSGTATVAGKVNLSGGAITTSKLTINNGATFNSNVGLTTNSLTISGGTVNLTSTTLKPINVTYTFTLSKAIDLNLACNLTKGTSYKLITYNKTNLTSATNLLQMFGLTGAGCKLTLGASAITLVVTDSTAWSKYIAATQAAAVTTAQLPATTGPREPVIIVEDTQEGTSEPSVIVSEVDSRASSALSSALVQSSWGTVHASRAFVDALSNRMQNATTLGESKSTAAWLSVLGGAGRISWDGVYAGSDYHLTGAAFGMQQQLTPRSTMGLAIGNSWGKVSSFGAPAIDRDTTHIALYGESALLQREKDALTLNWSAAYGRSDSDMTLNGINSEWEQKALHLNARATYGYALSERTTLSGFAGLEYLTTDSGDIAPGATSGSVQNLRGELGVSLGHKFSDRSSMYAELSFVGDMVRHNPTAGVWRQHNSGSAPGRAGINFSVGGSHALNENWSVNAAYNLELMQHANSHSANIGVSRSF